VKRELRFGAKSLRRKPLLALAAWSVPEAVPAAPRSPEPASGRASSPEASATTRAVSSATSCATSAGSPGAPGPPGSLSRRPSSSSLFADNSRTLPRRVRCVPIPVSRPESARTLYVFDARRS